ncbi:sigma factor, partial [Klebsiella pneumoniae]
MAAFRRQEAEDIVQDVLISLHVARAAYDPERPFLPWLLGIARIR